MTLHEANLKTRSKVEQCWRALQIRGLLLDRNQLEHDFRAAAAHFSDDLGRSTRWQDAAPYILSWYAVQGYSVQQVASESSEGMWLTVTKSEFGRDMAGLVLIANIGRPEGVYDFSHRWLSSEPASAVGAVHSQFDLHDLARFLTALFVVAYIDEYFWTLTNAAGMKDALMACASTVTGFSWESILDLSDRWSQVKAA